MSIAEETVANDGDTIIGFWKTGNIPQGNFYLVMQDGGGYSSILMDEESWREMKKMVDDLIIQFNI